MTTKHSNQIIEIQKRDTIIKKPLVVEDYNTGKSYIDRSDQMSSYSSPLKKTIKWYKKVAFDILLSTTTVNALSLFKSVTKNKSITITIQRRNYQAATIQTKCSSAYFTRLKTLTSYNTKKKNV